MDCYFRIDAAAGFDTLPRLLNHFAQRALVPARVSAITSDDMMTVEIDIAPLDATTAAIIREKIATSVLVERIDLRMAGKEDPVT